MKTDRALVAAGCFWGVQFYFDQVPGVMQTTVGYTGGRLKNPTYDDVCTGQTGYAESVLIEFDPKKISYQMVLKHFFRLHDPTQLNRQGPDVGTQYRSAIFYSNQEQRAVAIKLRNDTQIKLDAPVVTDIEPAGAFYPAEPYHQKFAERTGIGMCHIPYKSLR